VSDTTNSLVDQIRLSTAAKAGIGIGTVIGVLLVLCILWFLLSKCFMVSYKAKPNSSSKARTRGWLKLLHKRPSAQYQPNKDGPKMSTIETGTFVSPHPPHASIPWSKYRSCNNMDGSNRAEVNKTISTHTIGKCSTGSSMHQHTTTPNTNSAVHNPTSRTQ